MSMFPHFPICPLYVYPHRQESHLRQWSLFLKNWKMEAKSPHLFLAVEKEYECKLMTQAKQLLTN